MLDEGTLTLGEILEPKQYKRFILQKGEIIEETFTVDGRKYPLIQIRENLLKEHEKFMRDTSSEQLENMNKDEIIKELQKINELTDTTMTEGDLRDKLKHFMTRRHLLIWQDHSTLANHGHLLLMIRIMYDPAIYYTPPEMKDITGKEINVQDIIEKPAVYLLARARDTVQDKLSYIDTRMEDIQELSTKLKFRNQTEITDVMRFFSGDHPELCTEKGQQEGGHFPCAGCTCKASSFMDIEYAYRQQYETLEECRKKVPICM